MKGLFKKNYKSWFSNFIKRKKLLLNILSGIFKLFKDKHSLNQLKLINRSFNELRYAFKVFNKYSDTKKISIFGSARIPEDHPDYLEAVKIGHFLSPKKWMVITGAGNGIMKAGHEGFSEENRFGLAIKLPKEEGCNSIIKGNPKLINFHYFFTRKLSFLNHSHAIVALPGGFGTQDELFESLTLMQTGSSDIIPVVLLEGTHTKYWENWLNFVKENLLTNNTINEEDLSFFKICPNAEKACEYIEQFYKVFHSYTYVGYRLIAIRLNKELTVMQCKQLNKNFSSILESGEIEIHPKALKEETEHLNLPRLIFSFNDRDFAKLRQMIDMINTF
jgi:uncharacterized protein (TIGR00730 family)